MVCALGVLVPIAFAASIAVRRPVPVARSVPMELESKSSEFNTVVWTKTDLWPDQPVVTSLRRNATDSLAVEMVIHDLAKPDVLVYWAAGKATLELPDNARLLGALSNRTPLPLPADARGQAGHLLLYSLADHEIVAASKPLTL
jgi:hypothetical protein